MRFSRRIAIGAVVASLVPIVFAVLVFSNLRESARTDQRVLLAQQGLASSSLLERLVIDMETGLRGFRIRGDEKFLQPYNEAVAECPRVFSSLAAVLDSAEERKVLEEIRGKVASWQSDLAEPRIAAIREAKPVVEGGVVLLPALSETLDLEAGKRQMDEIRNAFDVLNSRQREHSNAVIAERSRADRNLSRLLLVSAIGFSLLMLSGALWLGHQADALQETREKLASVLESIGEGVVVADRNGKFTTFNPAAAAILGVGATATTPDQWSDTYSLLLPDGVTPFPAEDLPLARAIRGESTTDVEIHVRNSRPEGVPISISGRPIHASDGTLRGGVVVFRDISERRRAERALAARTAELESANRELAAFSYSVSHDLRAPLRAIDGFSQVLLEDCSEGLDATGRDALARIRRAASRMANLIDDLLTLSRVTRAELTRERVDLSALAGAVAAELAAREPGRQVELRIADGLIGRGDPALLRLALENLMGNAFKFTSKKERTLVEVGREAAEGPSIYFVKDNGAGFDMAYSGKLFGAFQRLHDMNEFPGTGIGLATVQRVVHRHGGRVWAEGTPGAGATFRFTLSEDS